MSDPVQFISTTPSGIEVLYQPAPKRLYMVRWAESCINEPWFSNYEGAFEWIEVPSVTTVLGCLDKPGLPWWGMKVGIDGVLELVRREALRAMEMEGGYGLIHPYDWNYQVATVDSVVGLLNEEKLTVNHQRDKAGDRGTAVHDAFEAWATTGQKPDPSIFPPEAQGYVVGLLEFLKDVHTAEPLGAEVMVGSIEHGFAGRYDVRFRTHEPHPVVVHRTPVRGPKYAILQPGVYLGDLKTSKDVYATHSLQLEAYEQASVECGYEPTVARGILNVSPEGTYKFVRSQAVFDDFLAVLSAYQALESIKERGKR